MEQRMADEIKRARSSLGAELVPYGAYETKLTGERMVRIPVERGRRRPSSR
jgi:hypothetical protein